jgi:lipoprotein-releasing system ATP-binding protein
MSFLSATALNKRYVVGTQLIHVLRDLDLLVEAGEMVAVVGASGVGKSTLLHLLGALDEPDAGGIVYDGHDIAKLSSAGKSRLRNTQFGFVFQFYHLLPELNVMENTLLGAMIEHSWLAFRAHRRELRDRAASVLGQLGMDHRLKHRPNQLSGGERQRVAIARALMNDPKVLFADEPTGNLDAETGRQIMGVFEKLHRERGQTIIMVTHDRTIARQADRVLVLKDGKISRPEDPQAAIATLDYQ